MGGHIDCYIDLSSFYSYLTLTYLLKNQEILSSHNVTIDFIPIFLGGVNVGSGNKPPWSLPAKAAYGNYDSDRAKQYHGMQDISVPDFFPPFTILPLRALTFIKSHYPDPIYISAFLHLFKSMWTAPHSNITLPGPLSTALASSSLFTQEQIEEILTKAGEKEWKDALSANTKKVLDLGAFGAPWFWVRNGEGRSEPFFGSDRFHFMWEFLGLPWQDIEILPKGTEKGKRKAKL